MHSTICVSTVPFKFLKLVSKEYKYDDGLDDFAIALLKTIYKLQHPEIQIFFYEKTEDGFVFMQIKDDKGDK